MIAESSTVSKPTFPFPKVDFAARAFSHQDGSGQRTRVVASRHDLRRGQAPEPEQCPSLVLAPSPRRVVTSNPPTTTGERWNSPRVAPRPPGSAHIPSSARPAPQSIKSWDWKRPGDFSLAAAATRSQQFAGSVSHPYRQGEVERSTHISPGPCKVPFIQPRDESIGCLTHDESQERPRSKSLSHTAGDDSGHYSKPLSETLLTLSGDTGHALGSRKQRRPVLPTAYNHHTPQILPGSPRFQQLVRGDLSARTGIEESHHARARRRFLSESGLHCTSDAAAAVFGDQRRHHCGGSRPPIPPPLIPARHSEMSIMMSVGRQSQQAHAASMAGTQAGLDRRKTPSRSTLHSRMTSRSKNSLRKSFATDSTRDPVCGPGSLPQADEESRQGSRGNRLPHPPPGSFSGAEDDQQLYDRAASATRAESSNNASLVQRQGLRARSSDKLPRLACWAKSGLRRSRSQSEAGRGTSASSDSGGGDFGFAPSSAADAPSGGAEPAMSLQQSDVDEGPLSAASIHGAQCHPLSGLPTLHSLKMKLRRATTNRSSPTLATKARHAQHEAAAKEASSISQTLRPSDYGRKRGEIRQTYVYRPDAPPQDQSFAIPSKLAVISGTPIDALVAEHGDRLSKHPHLLNAADYLPNQYFEQACKSVSPPGGDDALNTPSRGWQHKALEGIARDVHTVGHSAAPQSCQPTDADTVCEELPSALTPMDPAYDRATVNDEMEMSELADRLAAAWSRSETNLHGHYTSYHPSEQDSAQASQDDQFGVAGLSELLEGYKKKRDSALPASNHEAASVQLPNKASHVIDGRPSLRADSERNSRSTPGQQYSTAEAGPSRRVASGASQLTANTSLDGVVIWDESQNADLNGSLSASHDVTAVERACVFPSGTVTTDGCQIRAGTVTPDEESQFRFPRPPRPVLGQQHALDAEQRTASGATTWMLDRYGMTVPRPSHRHHTTAPSTSSVASYATNCSRFGFPSIIGTRQEDQDISVINLGGARQKGIDERPYTLDHAVTMDEHSGVMHSRQRIPSAGSGMSEASSVATNLTDWSSLFSLASHACRDRDREEAKSTRSVTDESTAASLNRPEEQQPIHCHRRLKSSIDMLDSAKMDTIGE